MQVNWKRISSLILVFAIVFTTLFNGVSMETVKAANAAITVDVTNLDAGATYTHDCSKYAVNKYDTTYHWKACSVCGKVIAGTKTKHSLKDNGWTMGSADVCSGSNHHVYTCSCGYSKNNDTGRAKHTFKTPCNCWGRHTHYHCTVCGGVEYPPGVNHYENCISVAKVGDCFTSFTCPTCGAKYVKNKSTKKWNIYNIDWKHGGETATHKAYEPDADTWNFSHNRLSRFGKTTSNAYLETDNEGVWCQDCGLKLIESQKSNYQIVNGEGVFTTTFVLPNNAELFSEWCSTTLYGTSGKYYSIDTSKQFKLKYSNGQIYTSKGTNFTKINEHTVKITSYIKLPTKHTEVPETISHEFQYKINGYRYRAISFCKYDVKNDGVVRHCIVPEKQAPTITSAKVTPVYSNGADGESWVTGVKLSFAGTENYCNSVTLRIRNANGSVIKTVKINVSNKNWAYNASLNLEGSVTGVNYTIEAEDSLYNVSAKKTFTVKKTDAKAPTVTSSAKTGTDWSKTKSWTASATDDGVGNVSIAFHKTSDNDDKAYVKAVANNSSYSTNYIFTGDVYGSKNINVVYKDGLGNETSKAVTISNLDNTAPTITDASTIYSENNETKEIKTGVKVTANDKKDFNGTKKSGSGIAGYAISTTNTVPSSFQASNVFSVTKSGTYYVFVKDNVGNVSAGKKVNVNVKRKITFNYNKPATDSALTGNETAYKYVAYNTAYGELPTPGLLGYTFNGWFTGNTAGTQITSKTTYATDSDTTAYAHWTLNNYSITYNLNADDATISGQPTSYNVNTKSFVLPTPVRKGYTFTGWTGSNGTDLALTVTIPKGSTGNKSYKAHWRANKLIVTYNKNGGIIDKNMSNYSQDIDGFSQEWQYNHVNANGGTTEDPINFSSFGLKRRDGYVRRDGAEWNTKPDGTGRSYDQDKSYTMTQFAPELEKGDVNLVLYAQWQPVEYSITYDLKGGSLSNQKTSYNVETATFTIPQPTKNGYTFTGWTGSNGTTPQTNVTVTKGSMGNKTYTANWSPTKYSITYNLNGGSLSGQKTEYTIETEAFTIPQPTKKGYIFSGWTGSNGSTAQKNVTIKKGSTGNRAYTANWAKNAYNLKIIGFLDGSYNANVTGYGTFDVYINGVQAANDCSFYNNTIPYGSKWEIKDIRTTTGHYYNGIRLGSATGTLEDKDTIVTLDFSTKKTVVTFYRNYNSSDSINESQTFVYGSPNQAFANINWKRQGYTLIGWSEDRNATTKMYDLTYPVSNGWILSKTHDQASSTVALYSVWQRDTYSISYDLKGGSINNAPTSYNVETGTFTIPQPTKNGYTFTGWTGSNGKVPNTSVSIQKGSVGNRSYTANWAPITYSITYDLKGGTANNLVKSYNIETASFSIPQPTKNGYTFTGWSGTGIQGSSKSVTINKGSTGNRTYTANWTPVNYGITYNLNGGTASGLKTSYTVETASFTLATPVKNGYTFTGWTGSNGTTPQTNVTIAQGSTGDRSYTANWNKIEYSITYDLKGGTANNLVKSYNIETASFSIPQPTKNGYTFTGWSGTGIQGSSKSVTINKGSTGNRTYTANWTPVNYGITYNLNGGTANGLKTSYTIETANFTLATPVKNGYTFAGWTGSNGTTPQINVVIAKGSTGNRSYTANWTKTQYSITYDLQGGKISNAPTSYNIETATFSIPQPTRKGYTFTGWTGTGIQGSSKNVTVNQGSIGNRTYKANWTPVNYGITYNLNGGTASGLKTSYTVETASFTLATPVKSGYTFIGWTGSNGTTPQTNVTIAQGSTGNRSYTANWNKIEYSITYDLQGGKINNAPTSYNVETATFHIPQPTKNGYTFTGWTGTGLSGLTKDVVVNKNSVGNRHYEANWQIITYSVTYNLDGGSISGQPTKYTVESATLNIPRPTKAGHTFLGWTGSNGNTNQMDVSIAHGSTGNKSYTAHWKINTYTMTVNHYKYNQRTGEWDVFKVTKDKADYGTVYIPGYDTPANYYNHHRDWDKGWTVTGDASFGVYYYPNSYKLDVNVWLDGVKGNNGSGYSDIRFNVYVNDKLTAQNVRDYSASLLYGDTYKIEMIANSKYTYEKQAYEGTVKDNVIVEPKVQTVPVVERTACVQSGNDDFYAYVYVSNLGSLDRVVFPSWTDEAGQDDLNPHWQSGEKADEKGNWTVNGQTYNYRKLIRSANHKVSGRDEHNWYNIHVYAYNGYGGKTVKTTTFAFQYNVGFNYNKPLNATSVVNNASENTKIVVYNTAYGTLPKPSMTGWTFNGWYTAASGGNKVEETNIYKYAYGTILYAHWTANAYRVNFDYNKPSNASGSIERNNVTFKNVTYDSAYGDLPNPALIGWRFDGWYTERTGGKLISKTTIYNIVAGDQTLYAHWTANTYTISFNKNQPSKASRTVQGTMNQIRYTYDSDNQKLPANRYSLTGWEFIGWKTSSDGTGKLYTDMDSIRNITSTNGANITMYAQWKQKTYTITFVYQDNKTQNAKRNVIFDSNLGNTVKPPIRTGYDFDYWCVKNNDHEGIHVYDNKGRWVNENSHTFWSKDGNWNHEGDITVYAHWTDRKTPQNTYLRAVSGNEICGTAGEIELGQNPTEVTPVIAKVTTYLQKPSMISDLAATLEGTDRNNILNGWQTEWFNFKDKNGNEKPVTLTLHSEDDGSGIANLSILDNMNKTVFKTQNFNNAAIGNISKTYMSSQETHFSGKAVDKAGNLTNTANLIIKGDTSMPYAASYSDGSTGFVLMTGRLDNPIGKQDSEYNGSCRFGHEIQSNLDSTLKKTNDIITGINDDGMRTEILAKVKDNGSGVKYVWAAVRGKEGTKIYPCRRSSKDKDVYVAVNGADHGSDKGKLPNLYTDFKQSTELSVYMFACDEAGNVAQINAKNGNGAVTNFSIYNQIIRDDKNFPSSYFTAPGYGPYFLLGQSGNIHIVTYGYVDSVDVEFPAELQAAALADKANPNLSAKVLGTKRMVKDADIGNRIQLLNDTTQNNCTRIADYAFVVPLSLNSDAVKNFMVNPEADADGNYNALPVSGNFKLKNIAPDGTVSYNAAFCLSGNEQAYAITTETAYKNSDTLISKAYFKCGNSESEADNGESITQKIHTHLVN